MNLELVAEFAAAVVAMVALVGAEFWCLDRRWAEKTKRNRTGEGDPETTTDGGQG